MNVCKCKSILMIVLISVLLSACSVNKETQTPAVEDPKPVTAEKKVEPEVENKAEPEVEEEAKAQQEGEPDSQGGRYSEEMILEILGKDYEPPFHCVMDHIDEEGNYVIHIYEVVDNIEESHTATVDWITVNPDTGEAVTFFDEHFNIEEYSQK